MQDKMTLFSGNSVIFRKQAEEFVRAWPFIMINTVLFASKTSWEWSGGAMVLGNLPVPGRPTTLGYSRARAYCAGSRCGWGLFGHFFSLPSILFSSSLSLGDGPI